MTSNDGGYFIVICRNDIENPIMQKKSLKGHGKRNMRCKSFDNDLVPICTCFYEELLITYQIISMLLSFNIKALILYNELVLILLNTFNKTSIASLF